MTTPFICLLIIMFLPLVLAGTGGYFRSRSPEGLDNRNPRAQVAGLEGPGARAYAAQNNAWEAIALFTPAVLVSHLLGADPGAAAMLAMTFVGFRVAHGLCYLADLATLRSLCFVGGLVCAIWLFLLGA